MLAAVVIAASIFVVATPKSWQNRMSTVETYDQGMSAMGRLLVWEWTLRFVVSHPLGGGFRADTVNHIVTEDRDFGAKAFHRIYLEVLGEHGFFGFGIFAALILNTIWSLWRVMRLTRASPDLAWCSDLARAMFVAFLVILACGAFIGIAFQCMLWYMFALASCISEYVRRVQAPAKAIRGIAGRALPAGASPATERPLGRSAPWRAHG